MSEQFEKDEPEIYHLVHWVCETYQNIDGLVAKVQEEAISKYFGKGTKAILLDLQSARGVMERTVKHVKEGVVISEAKKVVDQED